MPWDDEDLNDPGLYAPRNAPHVRKATSPGERANRGDAGRGEAAGTSRANSDEYRFDNNEHWNETLGDLPVQKPIHKPGRNGAPTGSDNPYARKRAPTGKDFNEPRGVWIRKGKPLLYATVIVCSMAILGFIGVMMMPQTAGYFWRDLDNFAFINGEILRYDSTIVKNYKQYRDYLKQNLIYQGIFIDNTYVGGMSVEDARKALGESGAGTANPFAVTVSIGNKTWSFDSTAIQANRNLDRVLQQAYTIGRRNTTDIIGTSRTPFRERVETALDLLEHYVYLKSDSTYDHDAVKAKVAEIVAYVNRDPVDAQIASFDFNTRTFTFSDEQPGLTIDGDALYQQVISKLDAGATNETITVQPVITSPKITKADLANHFKLVSAFTTDTTSSSNRNNNISLACQAINGTVLMPGETFSFNEKTGERTADKGYKMAGAISGGTLVDDYGGGVCQVSSTLFNAVARADLEVTSRSPHAWPSSYVKIGEDATVNWPSLDFKFTNNKDTPIFVIMYYKDRQCSAEIWGQTLGDGVTIDLDSKIVKTIEPSSSVNYVQNTSLPAGTSNETVKARTGYVVETYQVWYQNGTETKRVLLHTSTYKAYQRTVEYN
jgi:vancomycin resistance protein YoaR